MGLTLIAGRLFPFVFGAELSAGSIDFGLTEQAAPVVSSSRILMLLGRQEAELWALPAGDPLESVAQRLDQQTLHSDAPPQIWQAAMRLWVALGHRPEIVWKRFVGALEDQDAIDLLSLSELEAIEPWSAERRVQSLAALPQIVDQVFVVREEILW